MTEEIKVEKWGGNLMRERAAYYDNRIAIMSGVGSLDDSLRMKTDAFIIILCVCGKASFFMDGHRYDICKNDLVICHPNCLLEKCWESTDIEKKAICLSADYVRQLPLLTGDNWDLVLFVEKHPVLSLTEEEANMFCQYYDLLHSRLSKANPGRFHKELIDTLFSAFHFELYDMLERFLQIKPKNYAASESLFRSFIDLLWRAYPKDRSVAYYADHLHVTPKYLSAVCKEVSGHTASEMINRYVVKDIEFQLKYTNKSIKEIACEMDFPNLSFFGKYVKRHLKMSPREFREQYAGQSL